MTDARRARAAQPHLPGRRSIIVHSDCPVDLNAHNDNDRTWLDGLRRRYPCGVTVVTFAMSMIVSVAAVFVFEMLVRG